MRPLHLATICQSFFFLLLLLVLKQETHAQTFCATDEVHRHLLRANPEYKKTVELQNAKWQQYSKEITKKANRLATAESDLLEIPVVIHVIHTGEEVGATHNPFDTHLVTLIADLNAIFAGKYNAGNINTNGSAVIPIRFKLAKRSPDCQPSNGINRVNGSVVPGYLEYGVNWDGNPNNPGAASDASVKALSSWPNTAYLNIWLVTQIQGAGGYAYLPVGPPGLDGIVITSPGYVGILAHEVGHFLGLHHTFSGDGGGPGGGGSTCPLNDDCTINGDMICDTEPHYLQGCQTGINPCTNQPWGLVVRNFMNYGPCEGMFTAGQRDRMLYALEEFRGGLLTSLGGLPAGIGPFTIPSPVVACVPTGIMNPGNGLDFGPRRIQLANLLFESTGYTGDGNAFYIDRTIVAINDCISIQNQPVANLNKGSTYTITVTTGLNPENVRGWIDFNNNGVFQASERVISSNGTANNQTHSASFTVPAAGVTTCTSLRMRIMSDAADVAAPQPCSSLQYGQAEDFIVVIQNSASELPSVSIAANTTNLICQGTSVTFTATPVSGGNGPAYQWKKNGINVGVNSSTYISNALINGDIISCVMTPTVACPAYPVVFSNLVTMSVSPSPPSISITAIPAGAVCEGTNIVFKVSPVNEGSGPNYQWKKNGINIGTNSEVFSSNSLANGDVISCVMTILETCPATQSATSNPITVHIGNLPAGTIITPSPKAACLPEKNISSGYNAGPRTVTIADLQYAFQGSSGDNQNYLDHTLPGMPTCFPLIAHLNNGNTYTISVYTGDRLENVRGWIDYSNDGVFQTSELVISSDGTTSYQLHSSSFTVPVSAIANCTSLRMRIVSDLAEGNAPPEPCSRLQYGRVEDFIVVLQESTSIVPSVSISMPQAFSCQGANVTFTASPVNGGSNPKYQWMLNGISVGTNNNTYSSSTLKRDDVVHCIMTSSETGTCTPAVTSNSISMAVYPVTTPAVTISTNITGPVCPGTNVTFLAIPDQAQFPGFKWMVNGRTVSQRQYTYSTGALKNGDVVTCEVSSSDVCSQPRTATSNPIVIEVLPGPMPSVSLCANNGTFTATTLNFNSNPTYQWKLNGSDVGTNNSTYTNNDLGDGDFLTCVLTGSTACAPLITATSNGVYISSGTVVKPEIYVFADKPEPICAGTSVTFTASIINGGGSPKYQWKVGNTLVGTDSPTYTATNLTNGAVVTCTLTSNASCTNISTVTSEDVTVSVSAPPLATVAVAGPLSFCAGKNVLLKANTGTGYTYQWKKGGINIDNATLSNYTATTGGAYSVVVTNATGCSATSALTNVTVNPLPLGNVAAASALTFCEGKTVQLKAITGTGYTYQWKRGATDIVGATSSNYNASATGFYMAIVTNATGCSATSPALAVIVKPLPTATITPAGPTTFCSGKNVILKANTGTNYTYQWLRGATPIPGATQVNYSAAQIGYYSVIVTNSSGCSVTSVAVAISVNPLPVATITPNGPLTFCSGQNALLRANTGTNYTYQWRKAGINITGATQANYTATGSGAYSVVVTNAAGCAVTSAAVAVTANNAPFAAVAAAGPTTFCIGKSVLLKATVGTGYSYQWKKNNVNIAGETTSNYTATTAGNYSVVVSNASGCSTTSSVIPVATTPAPLASVSAAGPLTFCEGSNLLLRATVGTGYTYQWKKNGANIPAQTQSNFTATTTGVYTVLVTNAQNCTTLSSTFNITVTPAPAAIISAGGPLTFPQGGSVILNVPSAAGNTYQWKKDGVNITGATSDSYTANTSGSYTVSITNAGGCQTISQPAVVAVTQTRPITKGLQEKENITVYPNPLYRNNYLNIDWKIAGGNAVFVTIYDVSGKKINSQRLLAGDRTIKITGSSGVYIVECRWGVNKRKIFKVVKVE